MPNVWPAGLPQFITREYFSSQFNNAIKSTPAYGPPKFRRRATATYEEWQVGWQMTTSQYDTFLTFYHTTLKDGVEPFDFPHPLDSSTVSVNFMADKGYNAKHLGGDTWVVTGTLLYLRI